MQRGLSIDSLRKQANETDVTSIRTQRGLSSKRRKHANETDMTSKRHAKGLVLRLTEEASK